MKPLASLSLDLDNQWSYMKIHGDPGWETFPSYLDTAVPRILDFLRERNLTITFFIVGQDAALEKNHPALRAIALAGHEIGNHSFHHESWLHLYSEAEIEREIAIAEQSIKKATGQRPIGFRGPGFSLSGATLRVLARRGYLYDASTFPTFLGPLARAYYFMTSKLTPKERQQRKALFGSFWEGLRPLKPYRWQMEDRAPIEIPVTTLPLFKIPIHVSYLLYLSVFAPFLAPLYFRFALLLCRLTGTQPSLLLHPLDFLGCDDGVSELSFFPAMNLSSKRKLKLIGEILQMLSAQFEVVTVGQHAQTIARQSNIPAIKPHFKAIA